MNRFVTSLAAAALVATPATAQNRQNYSHLPTDVLGIEDEIVAPPGAEPYAVKQFYFGYWYVVDANGLKIGDPMGKQEANTVADILRLLFIPFGGARRP